MQVALGRREVGVAHRGLDARQVDPAGDEQRAIGVPEVVEAQRLEPGRVAGALKAAA